MIDENVKLGKPLNIMLRRYGIRIGTAFELNAERLLANDEG